MKKEKIKNILLIVIVALVTSFVTAYGVSSTFDSSNVCYKVDSNTGASVQDTIDDLYGRASDYSELKSYFKNNPTSYFDGEWLRLNSSSTSIARGTTIYDDNNKIRTRLMYDVGTDTSYLDAIGSSGTGVSGTLNLRGNPVKINGENLVAVKYKDITLENIKITSKSANGAYYSYNASSLNDLSNNNIIIGINILDWNGASASFVPYAPSNNSLGFMSDVSQTITQVWVRVVYI